MATYYDYWVTFRIREDTTGDRRRAAMVERAIKINLGRWMEPTSFMLLQTTASAAQLAKYLAVPLLGDRDLLVVSDLQGAGDSAYFGSPVHLATLKSFMPLIQKVG